MAKTFSHIEPEIEMPANITPLGGWRLEYYGGSWRGVNLALMAKEVIRDLRADGLTFSEREVQQQIVEFTREKVRIITRPTIRQKVSAPLDDLCLTIITA